MSGYLLSTFLEKEKCFIAPLYLVQLSETATAVPQFKTCQAQTQPWYDFKKLKNCEIAKGASALQSSFFKKKQSFKQQKFSRTIHHPD